MKYLNHFVLIFIYKILFYSPLNKGLFVGRYVALNRQNKVTISKVHKCIKKNWQ